MALHIEKSLCFDTPASRDEADQLAQDAVHCAGQVAWDMPHESSYVLTDEDYIHIASRYRTVPGQARVRVLMLAWRDTEGSPQARRSMMQRWRELKQHHEVKGTYAENELNVNKRAFREAILEQERAEADPDELIEVPMFMVDSMGGGQETRRMTRRQHQDMVDSIERAFGPSSRNPCAEIPLNRQESFDNHRRNVREFGDLAGRRQREAAEARVAAAQDNIFQIDWYNSTVWASPGPNNQIVSWPINQMEDQHLWETINWLARNTVSLFQQYQPNARITHTESLSAKHWLRVQPVFRALVQEAIRRRLTFPQDVYRYLRDYVLARGSDEIQPAVPWRDPEATYQQDELSSFLREEVDLPRPIDARREFGKEFRDIDLD